MRNVTAIGDKILAEMIDRPENYKKTRSGIFIADKDGDTSGIRPRWFKVLSVGPEVKFEINAGQYVYVEHGRWTVGLKVDDDLKVYMLDNKDLLLVSDEEPDLTDI